MNGSTAAKTSACVCVQKSSLKYLETTMLEGVGMASESTKTAQTSVQMA